MSLYTSLPECSISFLQHVCYNSESDVLLMLFLPAIKYSHYFKWWLFHWDTCFYWQYHNETNRKRMDDCHVSAYKRVFNSVLVHTDTISFYTIHNTVKNTPEVNTLYRTLDHVSCVPICGLLNLNHQHYRHMSELLSCNNVQCCITFHQQNTGSRQLCSSNHWQSSWRLDETFKLSADQQVHMPWFCFDST